MKKILSLTIALFIAFGIAVIYKTEVSAAQANGITSGKTYKITNVASQKCINVHYNYDENGMNVYQWTDDSSVEQKFRIVYDATYNNNSGGYRFFAKTSANGRYRVLDIVKSGSSVISGCNVEIWSPIDPVAQYFDIIEVSNGQYKIVPVSNSSLALTSYGTNNGTNTGTYSTSAGNIFVSTYTGSANQLWTFTEIPDADETAYANMAFSFPTSALTISSGYAKRYYDNAFHAGIDVSASGGTVIKSANTGTVVAKIDEPNPDSGRGYAIIIESSNDYVYGTSTKIRTIYMHMQSASPLSMWDQVTKGSTILGYVGNTGASSGNHLHFGVISDGSSGASLTQDRTLNPFYFYPNTSFTYSY